MLRLGLFLIALYSLVGTARAESLVHVDEATAGQIEASIDEMLRTYRRDLNTSDFSQSWLGDDGVLTRERFEKVVAWIASDAAGKALVSDVMKRARVKTVADLMSFITVTQMNTDESIKRAAANEGYRLVEFGNTMYSFKVPSALRPDVDRLVQVPDVTLSSDLNVSEKALASLYNPLFLTFQQRLMQEDGLIRDIFFVRTAPDMSLVIAMEVPRIILESRATLLKAILTVAHEFVHFAYATLVDRHKFIDLEKDEAAYSYVLGVGEEVDAHVFEMEFKVRLLSDARLIPTKVRNLFDSNGIFLGDRRAFADYVLDHLKYRKRFEAEYENNLIIAYNSEYKALAKLNSLLEIRELQRNQSERRVAAREADGEDFTEDQLRANACLASQVRIRKLIKEYEERIKKYEDKLGIVRKKKAA